MKRVLVELVKKACMSEIERIPRVAISITIQPYDFVEKSYCCNYCIDIFHNNDKQAKLKLKKKANKYLRMEWLKEKKRKEIKLFSKSLL